MILVVDLTDPNHPILRDEFVRPVLDIVKLFNHDRLVTVRHLIDLSDLSKTQFSGIKSVIICGTASADSWYLSQKLPDLTGIPVLGICAGMQILLKYDGGIMEDLEETGMVTVRRCIYDKIIDREEFSAYALHRYIVTLPKGWTVLARSEKTVHIVKKAGTMQYGTLFHPEVRNNWIIENFLAVLS